MTALRSPNFFTQRLAGAVFAVGDDRRGVVWENAGHRGLVVVAVGHGANKGGNLGAGLHHRIQIADVDGPPLAVNA